MCCFCDMQVFNPRFTLYINHYLYSVIHMVIRRHSNPRSPFMITTATVEIGVVIHPRFEPGTP